MSPNQFSFLQQFITVPKGQRQVTCSCVLDFAWGFWSSSACIVMAALMAKASSVDSVVKAEKRCTSYKVFARGSRQYVP